MRCGQHYLASQTRRPHAFRPKNERQSFRHSLFILFEIPHWGSSVRNQFRPEFPVLSQEESSMRIATAALLLMIASTLVACVHETTVFHSFNGADYFRGDPVAPADKSVSSQSSAAKPLPSR